jgi:AraC-like DNA-binding protein
MSRSQLHRKLKALTDQSSSEFIRNIRLKRAAELIKKKFGNTAEVSYEVGFNSVSYFIKCFKEVYGKTPTEIEL